MIVAKYGIGIIFAVIFMILIVLGERYCEKAHYTWSKIDGRRYQNISTILTAIGTIGLVITLAVLLTR